MTTHFNTEVVRLNVGGTRYDVSRKTLERYKGSMLVTSLSSDPRQEGNVDVNEPIFIDRNGALFQYVLDYLRTNEVYLPFPVSRAALKKEFYGIDADMNRVYQTVTEYFDLFDAMRIEKLATQTAALVKDELEKGSNWAMEVKVPQADHVQLCGHDNVLRTRLHAIGLDLVKRDWFRGDPYVKVKLSNTRRQSTCRITKIFTRSGIDGRRGTMS